MTYVSYLSARRTLRNFGIILLVLLVLFAASYFHLFGIQGQSNVDLSSGTDQGQIYAGIAAAASFLALIIATIRSSTLDALGRIPAITLTRPQSRVVTALRNYAVDAVTVIAAALMVVVLAAIVITMMNLWPHLTVTALTGQIVEAFAAVILMWYGLVTLLCTMFPGRGGMIVGLSWAFAVIAPGLSQITIQPYHAMLVSLLYIDPLAYLSGTGVHFSVGASGSGFIADPNLRTALAAIIGIVSLIIATRLWATKEAVA